MAFVRYRKRSKRSVMTRSYTSQKIKRIERNQLEYDPAYRKAERKYRMDIRVEKG